MISWFSRKKTYVEISSAEVEYMKTGMASCEVIWIHKFLIGLYDQELDPMEIYCDN
jgi:hypothetical protein